MTKGSTEDSQVIERKVAAVALGVGCAAIIVVGVLYGIGVIESLVPPLAVTAGGLAAAVIAVRAYGRRPGRGWRW